MSRLDSFIRRLSAQRDILNHVHGDLDLPAEGPIMEIGLGNGRTFNHLRELFPDRRIVAFDRAMGAHASSVPEDGNLVLGEIDQTAKDWVGIGAALVHADIGTGYDEKDAVTRDMAAADRFGHAGQGRHCHQRPAAEGSKPRSAAGA
ncbi:hypothetical protein QE369_003678 [Agrobacterium larrymoorei]|uniref:Uncharacterized protein n=1 Tax=Agrobacterium larrymoorei TaxID=160699 RepID=A0AAJ2ESV5_9HYPH|nr:hypothetical protein [Agrobacterium larrymoorei]